MLHALKNKVTGLWYRELTGRPGTLRQAHYPSLLEQYFDEPTMEKVRSGLFCYKDQNFEQEDWDNVELVNVYLLTHGSPKSHIMLNLIEALADTWNNYQPALDPKAESAAEKMLRSLGLLRETGYAILPHQHDAPDWYKRKADEQVTSK